MPEAQPKSATLAKWREELGKDFKSAVVLPASVWGEPDWPLRNVERARSEIRAFAGAVKSLRPVAVVARSPAALRPGSAAFEKFLTLVPDLKTIAPRVVWDPAGVWERDAAKRAVRTIGVLVVADPLHDDVAGEPIVYARMRGLGADHRYHSGRLEDLADALEGAEEAFVVFDTQDAWKEAKRMKTVLAGPREAREERAADAVLGGSAGAPDEDEEDEEDDGNADDDDDDDDDNVGTDDDENGFGAP